ncbi:MAG: hypothetical protein LBD78_02670 [Spirochaetaceae bacterium]|jgi:hypothetical protein|nr:hypothetical protein [Spirochaetaceae bacterium]
MKRHSGFLFVLFLITLWGSVRLSAQSQQKQIYSYNYGSRYTIALKMTNANAFYAYNQASTSVTNVYYTGSSSSLDLEITDNSAGSEYSFEYEIGVYDANNTCVATYNKEVSINNLARLTGDGIIKLLVTCRYSGSSKGIASISQSSSHLMVYQDNTTPVISITKQAYSGSNPYIRVSASASDNKSNINNDSWKYSINNGTLNSGNTVNLNEQGSYNIVFYVSDRAGNQNSKGIDVMYDTEAPKITISNPNGGVWSNTQSVTVSASATDNVSGVDENTWRNRVNSESSTANGSGNKQRVISNQGESTVYFHVNDKNGNSGANTTIVRLDRSPPVITFLDDMGSTWTRSSTKTISAEVTDMYSGIASIELSSDGGTTWTNRPLQKAHSFTCTAEGISTYTFRVKDKTGHVTTASGRVNIDRHAPIISNFTVPVGWIQSGYTFSGVTIKDSMETSTHVAGINTGSITVKPGTANAIAIPNPGYTASTGVLGNFTVPNLPDGAYSLVLSVSDNAGNTKESIIETVKVDGTAPKLTVLLNGVAYRQGNGWVIPLYITASEVHSGINHQGWQYSIDNGSMTSVTLLPFWDSTYSNCSVDIVYPGTLSYGTHSIGIRCVDNAKNETIIPLTFMVDGFPPVITADSLLSRTLDAAQWISGNSFALSAADSGSGLAAFTAEVKRQQSNGTWTTTGDANLSGGKINFAAGTPDGIFQILVQAKDHANNAASETFYVKVDRTGPVLTIPSGISGGNAISAQATDSSSGIDENSWEWRPGSGNWQTGKTAVLSEGRDRQFSFRVKDRAGNSTEKTGEITIDMGAPEVSAVVSPYGVRDSLGISSLSATDPLTAIKKLVWQIDDGAEKEISPSVSAVTIPLGEFSEGSHRIRFSATDSAGNTGRSSLYPFIIDRTAPAISGIEIREGEDSERILGPFDFTAESKVWIGISGEDRYRQAGGPGDTLPYGSINAWHWQLSQERILPPELSADETSKTAEFTISGLADGVNYIYFCAEDAAGNRSTVMEKIVLRDSSIPGAPRIRSTTHQQARQVEQADSLSDAVFRFTPAYNIRSGISRYQWQLQKVVIIDEVDRSVGMHSQGVAGNPNEEGEEYLSLSLEDNMENEFYRLSVQGIGGNGLTGSSGEYQFRIDSTAPNEIRVRAKPQVQSDGWYNDYDTLITWNKPADMTGVAEYRYVLSPDEDWIAPAPETLDNYDMESWKRTVDTMEAVDIRDILNGAVSGKMRIAVCAIDYAGNRRLGMGTIRSDFKPPEFETLSSGRQLEISDTVAEPGRTKRIIWGKLKDGESGVDYITLYLKGNEFIRTFVLPPETEEFVVDHLQDNDACVILVSGYDQAGNKAELTGICVTGDEVLPSSFDVPYREIIRGYTVSGKRIISQEPDRFADISLEIPGTLPVYEVQEQEDGEKQERIDMVSLEEIEVENMVIRRAVSREGRYRVKIDGFILEGSRISFDREQGAAIAGSVYRRPSGLGGASRQRKIDMGLVNFGAPSAPHFSSDRKAIGEAVDIETSNTDSDLGDMAGFPLLKVETTQLRSGKEWFAGTDIALHTDMPAVGRSFSVTKQDGSRDINMLDSRTEAETRHMLGQLWSGTEQPLRLSLGETEYVLKKAGVRGRYIDVYEAVLLLPEGHEPRELTIRNFSLDGYSGRTIKGPDFCTDSLKILNPNGGIFESQAIEFTADGSLYASGSITSEVYGSFQVDMLRLGNNGAEWETGARLLGFTATVHGFAIYADEAWFTRQGIYIVNGSIELYGTGRQFTNLGLTNIRRDDVYEPASITSAYTIQTGYGEPLRVAGGSITAAGVFGNVSVPLGTGVGDHVSPGGWEFPETRFDPQGAMEGVLPGSREITIADHRILASEITLLGSLVRIGRLESQLIPGLDGDIAVFSGLSFNEAGILTGGISAGETTFSISGWRIEYGNLILDGRGIGGTGSLSLPGSLGGLTIQFPDSLLHDDGSFTSGKAGADYDTALVYGMPVRIKDGELTNRDGRFVLYCRNPLLSLEAIDGPDLSFGETLFDSGGICLQGLQGSARVRFVSSNGYRVDAESCSIGDDGIYLAGKIGARWWDEEAKVSAAGKGIHLLPDYGVTGTGVLDLDADGKSGQLLYRYADWQITGGEFSFETSRIVAGSNRIRFRGITIELGELRYNSQGILERIMEISQDLALPMINGIAVRLTKTRFSRDGLEAGFSVSFPEQFGGHTLHFDRILPESNGNFYTAKSIDRYQFTLGGFDFIFKGIVLDSLGLCIEQAEIIMPLSLEKALICINDIRMSSSGITMEDSRITPVKFWEMEFSFDNFFIKDNLVHFDGSLTLPSKLFGSVPVKPQEIKDFTIDLNGFVRRFYIPIDGDYTISLLDAWKLSISNPYIQHIDGQPVIVMYNAKLLFPAGYHVKDAVIETIQYNLFAGTFNYETIRVNSDMRITLGGIEFVLNNLHITENLTVGFDGFAQMPSRGVPGFIAGKTLTVAAFEIQGDGSLGRISAEMNNLEGELIPGKDSLLLKGGTVSIIKQGARSVEVSIGGKLVMTSRMPGSLMGKELSIDTLTFDMTVPAITQLKAGVLLSNPVFFGLRFFQVYVELDWNAATQGGQLSLTGDMVFPNSFPDFLAGQIAEITDFVITLDGTIKSFGAAFSSPAGQIYNAIGSVQVSDVSVMASLRNGTVNCDLTGTIILPEGKFPEGIGGLMTTVHMNLDSASGLKTLYAVADLPDNKLFGTLGMRGVGVGIYKDENSAALIKISGDLLLPDHFPQGLANMGVSIRKFTMNTNAEIIDLDIGISNARVRIANTIELSRGSVNFRLGMQDEFLVDISGRARLVSAGLPQSIQNAELTISKLELSTRDGIKAFDLSADSEISFTLLGGIRIGFDSLRVTDSYISLNASAALPSYYPAGLANAQFDLTLLTLGWDGSLLAIEGGLRALQIDVAGFSATIEGFYFQKDSAGQYWITLDACKLQLPRALGSQGGNYISLRNARFNPQTRSFAGDLDISDLEFDIAGFHLKMQKPSIEFTGRRIICEKALLRVPNFMGNISLTLNQLSFSFNGSITVSGGGIRLPSFKVGNLQFVNVDVYFELKDSQLIFGGGGSVFIPGAGTVGAIVVFADRSDTYPLGLKRAEFSYTLAVGGIPLGNSGLFINGLSGGIAYGPPDELPEKVQGFFEPKGPRLKLGISIGDGFGGKYIDIKPVTWVDINNAAWAFHGDGAILRGSLNITATITAALNRVGFYGGTNIELKFVRGGVEFYIFDKSGKVIFSGEGYVQFGLARGSILDTNILFIPTVIPPRDMWLGSVNAEFGHFTNGSSGFKGTVDVPLLGNVGIFVGSGGVKLGDVSHYRIEKPSFAAKSRRSSRRVSAANGGVVSNDAADRDSVDDTTWEFFIPPSENFPEIYPGSNAESGLDRIILVMAYVEGDPAVSVVDPAGTVYGEGLDNTKMNYMENIMAITISAPRAGLWQVRVSGVEEDVYQLEIFGNKRMPVIEFAEPAHDAIGVTESLSVRGTTDQKNRELVIRAHEASGKPALELGTTRTDRNGAFEAAVPVFDLPDGEYRISARFTEADAGIAPAVYAPGRMLLDRSARTMLVPGKLRAAETDRGVVILHWENTNGGQTAGYNLRVYDKTTGREDVFYLGNITAITLPGYNTGQELFFSVSALDDSFRESEYTKAVEIVIGREKPAVNRPSVPEAVIKAAALSGDFTEGTVRVAIEDYHQSEDSSGYITARQISDPEQPPGSIRFRGPVKLTGNTAEIPWIWDMSGFANPGIYTYSCEVINEADGSLRAPFIIEITVTWPRPVINRVEPAEVNGSVEQILTIYGSGFLPGIRALWQGEELPLASETNGSSPTILDVRLPVQTKAGEYQISVAGAEPAGPASNGTASDGTVNNGTAQYPVTVVLPCWRAVLYTRVAETVPGGNIDYPVGISGLYGFEGTASFTVIDKMPELEVNLPVIPVNQTGMIRIRVKQETPPGTYKTLLRGDGGQTLEFITIVRESLPGPRLSSLSPPSGYTGTEVRVYGYGFGDTGTLYLHGEKLDTLLWQENEIVFTVPDTGTSGTIYVATDLGESNGLIFTLRDRGFTLRTDSRRIPLTPGENKTLGIFLSGYADIVQLKTEVEPEAPIKAVLREHAVTPNAMVELSVTADSGAGNGTWKVLVRGNSRGYEAALEFTIHIGNAFVIEALDIPEGLVDVSYYGRLTGKYGTGEITYRVVRGDLPQGLELNWHGEISGYPKKTGRYEVWIEGQDRAGRSDTRAFIISIVEETWGQAGKDGGHSLSVSTNLPAGNSLAWTWKGSAPADYILAAKDRVIVVSAEGISALHFNTGKLMWTTGGTYKKVSYAGGRLYSLIEENLETRDPDTGVLLWQREGIEAFSTDGALILADDGSRCLVIEGEQGTLIEQKNRNYQRLEQVIWKNGCAFEILERAIIPIHGAGLRWETEERIITAAADADGLVVATEEGLVILDRNHRIKTRITHPSSADIRLALARDAVLVLDHGIAREYSREDSELRWNHAAGGSIAAGKDKALIAGINGLMALNRFTGNPVWKDEKPCVSFALYHEKIISADSEGNVSLYHGTANMEGPETRIRISPARPDGKNGWYTTPPLVQVESFDRETYVEEIRVFVDDETLDDPENSFIPPDGEHQIRAYGVDSMGLRGADALIYVKTDRGLPESNYTLSVPESGNGWFNQPVTISLEGWDEVSELDQIWTSLGVYGNPVLFAGQGIHNFYWYAIDRAGNTEAVRNYPFRIDLEEPHAEASVLYDTGIAEVTINGWDNASGIDVIEYRINGGVVEQYGEPLWFTDEGRYQIQYRAVDKAGNSGAWFTCEVLVTFNLSEVPLIENAVLNGQERLVMYNARNGMPILRPEGTSGPVSVDKSRREALLNLPSYAIGGEYLLWEAEEPGTDAVRNIGFRVSADVVVYLFIPRGMKAPGDWSLIEENRRINRTYYPGGTGVYMKRFNGGSRVTIEDIPGCMTPPLVLVQERRAVFAGITVWPEETTLPGTGTNQSSASSPEEYKGGTRVILEALISPWQYSRRLPLRKRWFVSVDEEWLPLEGNRYDLPDTGTPGYLRFRVEIYTPDGQTEYRTEKVIDVIPGSRNPDAPPLPGLP